MMREVLEKLVRREDLALDESADLMRAIMSGDLSDAQVAGVLVGLRAKGETVEEITGFARAMREKSVKVTLRTNGAIDTCGTGGDASSTFNISTAAAIVAAAAGVPVAKHGNRSVSSHCGSADVLEALGVDLSLSAEQIGRCVREVGIGFMFAPMLHGAMKH
ncbi:MAG: anthranilate phosphoribosyltransferase, partial [Hyphomicrobiaceae bacterium]|nr:anthranilate phosphoribosyltransferase [Hyphomicrobiaceae bacterium]